MGNLFDCQGSSETKNQLIYFDKSVENRML